MDDWYSVIAAEAEMPPDAARQLCDIGFVVMPGPVIRGGCARLAAAYDRAVLTADPADVSIRSSTRVHDFVNRGPEFDGLYIYRPLLAACCRIIGRPFKLSTMHARTLEPGAPAQPLHVDVEGGADAYEGQVLACGPAGSIIIFNGSVWHGHTANRSARRRRSIQGAFVPREARPAINQASRIRPETLRRISGLAKYVLDVGP